uniref:ATP synthase subunit 8 n=1 Tax=Neothoracaphis yanonis TaxID=30179 RepID=A0A1L1YM97_9HEMI|nr:ATP synthase subunit 8 [Neothoracaphis yanonis]
MAPMNWLILFMFFMIMFYLLMNNLYFNFNKMPKMNKSKKNYMKNYNKFI